MMNTPLASFYGIENWLLIAVVGLLIFGRRLPEVGRNLGRTIVEFKRGATDIEAKFLEKPQANMSLPSPDRDIKTGYRFDPFTGEPIEGNSEGAIRQRFD